MPESNVGYHSALLEQSIIPPGVNQLNQFIQMEYFAVIGNPVEHSLSPRIHEAFAAQFGIELEYGKILAGTDCFVQEAGRFSQRGGQGLNVTVPFKQQAFEWVQAHSRRAGLARAVNTISFREKHSFGDNTDGTGLVRDIGENLDFSLRAASILVLGAGGAARGILGPLLESEPRRVVVANRTESRARELANHFAGLGNLAGCGLDRIPERGYDIVINATAAGLESEMPRIPKNLFGQTRLAYDLVYAPRPTPFLETAGRAGVLHCHDGLGMLVEQAAESFRIWHSLAPDTAPVLDQLNRQFGRAPQTARSVPGRNGKI